MSPSLQSNNQGAATPKHTV